MYTAFKKLQEEEEKDIEVWRRGLFFSFEMGTQDYKMESVNKRHFLGTTFKMLWVYNTTSPNKYL